MAEVEARAIIYLREHRETMSQNQKRIYLLITEIANVHLLYFRNRVFVHGVKIKSLSVWFISSNKSVRLILQIKNAAYQVS